MRLVIVILILTLTLPVADAAGSKGPCKDRCSAMYKFCLGHATTKQNRDACKAQRKSCKGQCG
jgi:hypothetical protein